MGSLANKMLGWRKVAVFLAILALSTALLLAHVITGDQWVELLKFVAPSFFAASLISKYMNGAKTREMSE